MLRLQLLYVCCCCNVWDASLYYTISPLFYFLLLFICLLLLLYYYFFRFVFFILGIPKIADYLQVAAYTSLLAPRGRMSPPRLVVIALMCVLPVVLKLDAVALYENITL